MPESKKQTERPHVIRQGDTPLRLAVSYDIPLNDIALHEKNKDLRDDFLADMLPVGETITIPMDRRRALNVSRGGTNKYAATVPMHRVVIVFSDGKGPLKSEPYQLKGLAPDPIDGALDPAGKLDLEVPVFIEDLTIVFPKRHVEHRIWVGHLAPSRQDLGCEARLLHLGYGPTGQGVGDPFTFNDREARSKAIEGFQEAFALEKTGFADVTTLMMLSGLHDKKS